MGSVLVAPDLEAVAITALRDAGLRASTAVPNPRPAAFVRVRARGGVRTDRVLEEGILLVECWAIKEADASDLARLAAGVLAATEGSAVAGVSITSAEILGSIINDPDPDSSTPRYTLSVQLVTFATERQIP